MDIPADIKILPFPLNTTYLVFSNGEVYDLERQRFLSNNSLREGYIINSYRIHGFDKKIYLQRNRVIAKTFIPVVEDEALVVHHIDENKLNNSLDNLEWCTWKENLNKGSLPQLRRVNISKRVVCLTLDWNIVDIFESQKKASEMTGVSTSNISHAIRNKRPDGKKSRGGRYYWIKVPDEYKYMSKEELLTDETFLDIILSEKQDDSSESTIFNIANQEL